MLTNVKTSRDEKSWEAEVRAEIPAEALARYRIEALKEIQRSAKLDGFRPGKAPLERVLEVYGEGPIMRRAAELAIQSELPELLAKENLLVVESPRVTTEEPVAGKPLSFTARASLVPKVELPDYAAVAAKHSTKEEVVVSDDEHKEALTHLRRERARIDKIESGTEAQKASEESRAMKEEELPALDDMFVQSLGYESAEKFAEVLRSNIKNEKEIRTREKRRAAILDDLVERSKVSYPAVLREFELDEMEARLKSDIERAGMTFEGYLNEAKKTRDELRASWGDAADKRAKVRLILVEIARKEKIEPPQDVLEKEVEHAKQHYPSADPAGLRAHITHAMRNETTLRFLESNPEPLTATAHDHSH